MGKNIISRITRAKKVRFKKGDYISAIFNVADLTPILGKKDSSGDEE